MLYRRKRYQVDVAPDGAIKVKPGDWLSKYSYAMYGNFDHIGEFGRMNNRGVLAPVQDPNRIIAGETLYHLPTYNKTLKSPGIPPPAPQMPRPKLSQQEKEALIKQLSPDFKAGPETVETIEKAVEFTDDVSKIAEMFEFCEELGPVGAGLAVIGVPIQTIAMWKRFDTQQKMAAARALAYAETAWAFNEPVPPLSPQLRTNILKGGGMGKEELVESEQAWNRSARDTFARLDAKVAQLRISKESAQAVLRAKGDDDRGKLCGKILKELDEQIKEVSDTPSAFRAWQAMHDVVYPQ